MEETLNDEGFKKFMNDKAGGIDMEKFCKDFNYRYFWCMAYWVSRDDREGFFVME